MESDRLGATVRGDGVQFRVWAPESKRVEVELHGKGRFPLIKSTFGYWSGFSTDARAGDRYQYRLDGRHFLPDPASRFQPDGPHGPSEIVDPQQFPWTDADWVTIPAAEWVVYELHVGTFTPIGTYRSAAERLPYLVELGVTVVELMPLADFPGRWNWGYDGVDLFAPSRNYGRPDDLRFLINTAHRLGLAVVLDVVYNHFGPSGNYLPRFSPFYFSSKYQTPWGQAINFDGRFSRMVREFILQNAVHWIEEYHFDGLRLDATEEIHDSQTPHLLAELADRVHAIAPQAIVVAEDFRNDVKLALPSDQGGYGLDGMWVDDFHHQSRRFVAGDHESYYADFTDSADDLATILRDGWLYQGQWSVRKKSLRGTPPQSLPFSSFVWCIQNHDQIGNRPFGDRLHHVLDAASYRALSALLLTAPAIPLLFMGQEWATSSPFQYFTDHDEELGRRVTEGRRREFSAFSAFADPHARSRIPDPQAEATFTGSKLHWEESTQSMHAAPLRLYRRLLHLRRSEPALRNIDRAGIDARVVGERSIALRRGIGTDHEMIIVACFLAQGGVVDLGEFDTPLPDRWQVLLSTEDVDYCGDPSPIDEDVPARRWRFHRPGVLILRHGGSASEGEKTPIRYDRE